MIGASLPEEAFVVALLTLPNCSQGVLARLLGMQRASAGGPLVAPSPPTGPVRRPSDVWSHILDGRLPLPDAPAAWVSAALDLDVGGLWRGYERQRVSLDLLGQAGYPDELAGDKQAPFTLFRVGQHQTLGGRRVSIVGTRRCTPEGRAVAHEFGRALASAGVRVVSGLALGVDGAAHAGALEARAAPPIGVVAGGLDRPYPARHRALWRDVAATGVLVSEWPRGVASEGWRFAARNRIIATLGEVLLVVESRETGGSMVTVDLALDRGVTIMAVPGSVRSPAAAGTNRLIRDGAAPALDPSDVLSVLGIDPAYPAPAAVDLRTADADPDRIAVLAALGWVPIPTATVVSRTRLDPARVAAVLVLLELDGVVTGGNGWWQRRRP